MTHSRLSGLPHSPTIFTVQKQDCIEWFECASCWRWPCTCHVAFAGFWYSGLRLTDWRTAIYWFRENLYPLLPAFQVHLSGPIWTFEYCYCSSNFIFPDIFWSISHSMCILKVSTGMKFTISVTCWQGSGLRRQAKTNADKDDCKWIQKLLVCIVYCTNNANVIVVPKYGQRSLIWI